MIAQMSISLVKPRTSTVKYAQFIILSENSKMTYKLWLYSKTMYILENVLGHKSINGLL